MKILRKITLILASIVAVSSCDVLNVEPSQSIPSEGAITSANDLERALMGCYDGLQSGGYYGLDYLIAPELVSDNLIWTGTSQDYGALDNNVISPDLFLVEGVWSSIYTVINRANNALYYLPGVENLSEDDEKNYEGELRFIRALAYFDLVKLFGGVPLRELPALDAGEDLYVPRSSEEDVYDFIITELIAANTLLINTNKARATQAAAKALLARAYLYSGDYNNAWDAADYVIENYSDIYLADTYDEIFQTEFSSESIFEISFNDEDGNRIAQYFSPRPAGRHEFAPSEEIIGAYHEDDLRFNASIDITTNEDEPAVAKYTDVQLGSDNIVILRLAEMYLIRAEAEANKDTPELNDIIADINAIRTRADLVDTDAATLDELKEEILLQRRFEFAFDGHRWFDLIRTGKALEVLDNVTSEHQLLFPIPQSEILSNDAIKPTDQNPGY